MAVSPDDPGTSVAVYDWDMATRGDPLADLGTLMGSWYDGDEEVSALSPMPTHVAGWMTREEAVATIRGTIGPRPGSPSTGTSSSGPGSWQSSSSRSTSAGCGARPVMTGSGSSARAHAPCFAWRRSAALSRGTSACPAHGAPWGGRPRRRTTRRRRPASHPPW